MRGTPKIRSLRCWLALAVVKRRAVRQVASAGEWPTGLSPAGEQPRHKREQTGRRYTIPQYRAAASISKPSTMEENKRGGVAARPPAKPPSRAYTPSRNQGIQPPISAARREPPGDSDQNTTHSSLLFCTTLPLSSPRISSWVTSLTWEAGTNAGPTGHAPSNDLE